MTATLIYHDIVEPATPDAVGFPGRLAGRYKHAPEHFEAHLDALAATGARIDLIGPEGPLPAVALTFDDGGASALQIAGLLEQRDWRGHFFVTTDRIGTAGFLDATGVRELAARGHDVGSHSASHPAYMERLPRQDIEREWMRSRDRLTDILGTRPIAAAIPGGFGGPSVLEAVARTGYRVLMTSDPRARVQLVNGVRVVGRYTIWATTVPQTAAAYARGDRLACARLRLEWSMKGMVKRASPRMYDAARRLRAGGT